MDKKAFIGPIGDDIPSIFPIVAGLLLFIGSYFYIDSQIKARDAAIDIRKSVLQMSYIVTEKGIMEDLRFAEKCQFGLKPFASKRAIDFAVVLKKYCGPIKFSEGQLNNLERRVVDGQTIEDKICTSDKDLENSAQRPLIVPIPEESAVTLTYPIAVECAGSLRGTGVIAVTGWLPRR